MALSLSLSLHPAPRAHSDDLGRWVQVIIHMYKTIYLLALLVVAGCGARGGIRTEVVIAKDDRWEYVQTSKDGCVIARYVDMCGENKVMISRLFLDGEMNVMYFDEYRNGIPAFRYKGNGELWVDFTKREKINRYEMGCGESGERAKSRDEVVDAVAMATRIGFEALKMIK